MSVVEQERVEEVAAPKVMHRDVLLRAADLLEEFGWTQGKIARDSHGSRCHPADGGATSFCITGSIQRAQEDFRTDFSDNVFVPVLGGAEALVAWNDEPDRTRQEVVARLRSAAERSQHV